MAPDKRIKFRIGINLGDVVVEDDGDLMGDGVNVAAPMEEIRGLVASICLARPMIKYGAKLTSPRKIMVNCA